MSDITSAVRLTQEPQPVKKPAMRVAGPAAVFGEENRAEIPKLWPKLVERLPLPAQQGGGTYGVGWAASGVEGCFNYMAAVAIAPDAPVPEGFEAKDIAERSYLIFRLETDASDLHTQMQAAMRQIWANGRRLPASSWPTRRTSRSIRPASIPAARAASSGGSPSKLEPWATLDGASAAYAVAFLAAVSFAART